MTTDNTNESAKIAGTLSAEELAALESFSHGNEIDYRLQNILEQKGMLRAADIADDELTPLGREMVAIVETAHASPHPEGQPPAESFVKGDTVYKVNANPQDLIPNGTKGVVQDISDYNGCASVDFEGYGSKVIVTRNLSRTKQPPPATAAGSGGDAIRFTVGQTVRYIRTGDEHTGVVGIVTKVISPLSYNIVFINPNDVFSISRSALEPINVPFVSDDLQAELTALRAQLQAAEDCGADEYPPNSIEESLDEIWRFADADIGGADDINDADSYIDLLAGKMANIREEIASARKQLTALRAQLQAVEAKADKLQKQMKMVDHMSDVHEEQYKQERDNSTMLYKALIHNTSKEIYEPILAELFQSTNEYDKLMSEGSRWKERHQREVWAHEETQTKLQASEDTVRGLRSLAGRAADKLYLPNLNYNSPLGQFIDELRQAAKVGDE